MILDQDRGCLRDSGGADIALRPKSLDLLRVLARSPGQTLTKAQLLDAVWPNVCVTEDSLFQCVRDIRRALGDVEGRMVRTLARQGYLLDVPVTGAPLLHIPYKGDAQAMIDLVGGVVGAGMNGFGTPLPHVTSGKLRALAAVGKTRMPQLPDVPTFAEAGFPRVDAYAWFGLLAPKKASPEIIARLNAEMNRILKEPAVIERMATIGAVPIGGSAAEFDAFIRKDIERWREVVKERSIKVN